MLTMSVLNTTDIERQPTQWTLFWFEYRFTPTLYFTGATPLGTIIIIDIRLSLRANINAQPLSTTPVPLALDYHLLAAPFYEAAIEYHCE